jgi:hypothetical protein
VQEQAWGAGEETYGQDALLARRIVQAIRDNPGGWLDLSSCDDDWMALKVLRCYDSVLAEGESPAVTVVRRLAIKRRLRGVQSRDGTTGQAQPRVSL